MNTNTRMKKLPATTRATIAALVSVMQNPAGLRAAGGPVQKALENICVEAGIDKATPQSLIPLTVERENFDTSAVYETQISPLLSKVAALCDAHGIPFLFTAHTSRREDGTEEGAVTFDVLHSELNVLNPRFDLHLLEGFNALTKDKLSDQDHLDRMRHTMAGIHSGGIDLSPLFGGPARCAQDDCAAAPAAQAADPAPEPQPVFGAHSGPAKRPAARPKAPAPADIKSNSRASRTVLDRQLVQPKTKGQRRLGRNR